MHPRQKFQAYVLYGNFPMFKPPKMATKEKKDIKPHGDPLRANYRALIPFELSEELRKAIINQKSIFDFMEGEE